MKMPESTNPAHCFRQGKILVVKKRLKGKGQWLRRPCTLYKFSTAFLSCESFAEYFQKSNHSSDHPQRLLFMTYNGWVMLAVAVGAFSGYLAFGSGMSATKSVACH